MSRKILVTGGAGFIGSHLCIELINEGYEVVIFDNFSNSRRSVIEKINSLSDKKVELYIGELTSYEDLRDVFSIHNFFAVMHLAGLKSVSESFENPLSYYTNNVSGSLCLISVMQENNCKRLVFSSSCTVYGTPMSVPIREDSGLIPINPYGKTKLLVEQILKDQFDADHGWQITSLRYFNPIGCHHSGILGEESQREPNNIIPSIIEVVRKQRKELLVYGDDYQTIDGTGVRDYIHVVDLAKGHINALHAQSTSCNLVYNLGTGRGYSVLELLETFAKISGEEIP
jgi:UDP-glucose 4-epimerase